MFQIVQASPIYHWSTDAMIGTKFKRHEMSYHNEQLALKLAGRMEDENYRNCGDDYFFVVPYGGDLNKRIYRPVIDNFDDMPF